MTDKELSGKKKLIKALEKCELCFAEKYPPADIDVEFSKQYEHYMESLLAGKIKKRRKCLNTPIKRIAACIAAAMIIFGSSMTVKAFREPVVEFFTNAYEKIVEIFFGDDDIANAPSEIETVYTLGYVPDGYVMESYSMNEIKTTTKTVFTNNEAKLIFCQYILGTKAGLDNEDTNLEYLYIGDMKVLIVDKNETRSLFWNTNEYAFSLDMHIQISEDEWIAIIRSITEKD